MGCAEAHGQGSFWLKAEKADKFILLDTVQFSHQSYTQRAKLPNGHRIWHKKPTGPRSEYLTVPVKHPVMVLIKDVEIAWGSYRLDKHILVLRNLTLLRGMVKPFIDALELLADDKAVTNGGAQRTARDSPWRFLANWNTRLIEYIAEEKAIDSTKFIRASRIVEALSMEDTPLLDMPWNPLSADERLALLVEWLGGDTYLMPEWSDRKDELEPDKLAYLQATIKTMKNHGIEVEEVT